MWCCQQDAQDDILIGDEGCGGCFPQQPRCVHGLWEPVREVQPHAMVDGQLAEGRGGGLPHDGRPLDKVPLFLCSPHGIGSPITLCDAQVLVGRHNGQWLARKREAGGWLSAKTSPGCAASRACDNSSRFGGGAVEGESPGAKCICCCIQLILQSVYVCGQDDAVISVPLRGQDVPRAGEGQAKAVVGQQDPELDATDGRINPYDEGDG